VDEYLGIKELFVCKEMLLWLNTTIETNFIPHHYQKSNTDHLALG
jgi:hypothetical protein